MSGEISALDIERALIMKRVDGEIAGIPEGLLDQILGRMRAELLNPFGGPPGPPAPPPTP